ncbi:MBL fold metallo-hydrolase [Polaribacter aestuariivivens]|uniref:MBL fold metallo-hydrolase n=1 Tax=Polaribacter aestuariivivens TaxID=2304626 RepID=A0A5S3N2R3_9FLAO|nr:MBL fold metallo-hydrolase [Polaribacter aestuariivivens]TMM28724.1 MBL fold metallo-hydrolase [Polaribacter aestuariivivens]
MKNLHLSFLLLFVFFSAFSQKNDVKITTEKLTESIYILKGQGGNIGLFVGEESVFMIDDQFAPLTPKILSAIKKITTKPVKYLVNSHWHGDHTGGNENMQKAGALIIAQENVRKRMNTESQVRGKVKKASPKEALPVITFSDNMMLHINNDDILISHVHNAHTDGDAIIYFTANNVVHMGDTYFQGKFPYIDLNSGGNVNGVIAAAEKVILLSDENTKIIPGHGNVSNRKELIEYKNMLVDLKNKIQLEINKEKSLEEVLKNKEITKGYDMFSGWINEERIKTAIYKSLEE